MINGKWIIPELGLSPLSKIDSVKGLLFFNSCKTFKKEKLNLEEALSVYLT